MRPWTRAGIPLQPGRLAVITGATGGFGYETACALAVAGAQVVLTGRNPAKGAAALERIRVMQPGANIRCDTLDLGSLATVQDFAERLRQHGALDILVNNGGVMAPPTRQPTAQGFELQFGTNSLSQAGHADVHLRVAAPQRRAGLGPAQSGRTPGPGRHGTARQRAGSGRSRQGQLKARGRERVAHRTLLDRRPGGPPPDSGMHAQHPPIPPIQFGPSRQALARRRWPWNAPVLLAVCLAGHLGVSGCAAWAPSAPTSGPALAGIDLPARWSADDAAGAGAAAVTADSLAAWWQRFDDPLLGDLVGRALRSNTSVAGARAALRQAEALRDVAAAALLPTLGASGSAQHTRVGATAGSDSAANRFQLGLDALWVPDVFGARRDARDAADAVAAASAASLGDTQVQVAAQVASGYILLRSQQTRWAIASQNLASQQETWQITDWRQQAGLVTALEVEQARAAAAQTRALLPALQTSVEQTAHVLAVLLGLPPASLQAELGIAAVAVSAAEPSTAGSARSQGPTRRWHEAMLAPSVEIVPSIPADTLRQRADVRAAEYQVAAALARVGQAEAQRWPSFSIGGSLGLSAVSAAALTHGASVLGSLLASVSLPVFDGGAARAQVRVQQAALAQAQQVYRAAVLGALKDVEDALVAQRGDGLRLASLRVAADAAGTAAELARQRYSSGLVDFQTVLETQRNQLATQDNVVGARADLANDQVRLFTALGGGWRVTDEPAGADKASMR